MCGGGSKSTPQPVAAPPPSTPTTFDYNVANRGQTQANEAARRAQSAKTVSSSFGSELGTGTEQQRMGG